MGTNLPLLIPAHGRNYSSGKNTKPNHKGTQPHNPPMFKRTQSSKQYNLMDFFTTKPHSHINKLHHITLQKNNKAYHTNIIIQDNHIPSLKEHAEIDGITITDITTITSDMIYTGHLKPIAGEYCVIPIYDYNHDHIHLSQLINNLNKTNTPKTYNCHHQLGYYRQEAAAATLLKFPVHFYYDYCDKEFNRTGEMLRWKVLSLIIDVYGRPLHCSIDYSTDKLILSVKQVEHVVAEIPLADQDAFDKLRSSLIDAALRWGLLQQTQPGTLAT